MPKLKLYCDLSALADSDSFAPILIPFRNLIENPLDPEFGRFDAFKKQGRMLFELGPLAEADVAVLPFEWSTERAELANRMADKASRFKRPLVIFFNNDSDEEITVSNAYVFRTSFYRSRRKATEFAVPGWSVDFTKMYCSGVLPLRRKTAKASVSFCGLVPQDPSHVRRRAIAALEKSQAIHSKLVLRSEFWGGAFTAQAFTGHAAKVRAEYVENTLAGDYVLCARGAGNFSYRLYEALSCGRIPVFIDSDCVLPYDFAVDWKEHLLWIHEHELESVGQIIADFHDSLSEEQFIAMQEGCRRLWEQWICPEGYFTNFYKHFSLLNGSDIPSDRPAVREGQSIHLSRSVPMIPTPSTVEPDVVQAISEIVREGWVCADVGAHRGLITTVLAQQVGSTGRVVALEAHPENARALSEHLMTLGLQDRVEVKNVAVTDGSNPLVWLYPGRRLSSFEWNIVGHDVEGKPTEPALQVEAVCLDSLFPTGSRLDFVKVDIEGAASQAFAGMRRLLRETQPCLLIEFHDENEWAARSLLFAAGYELRDLKGRRVAPVKDSPRLYHCLAIPPKMLQSGPGPLQTSRPSFPSAAQPAHEVKGIPRVNCLFLNTYYPAFLRNHYGKNQRLSSLSYSEQMDSLLAEAFGDSDFYSRGMEAAGWAADNLIINCAPLQKAWAREAGVNVDGLGVALEQIRRRRPQVVYIQDLGMATQEFLKAIRPYTELIVGQIACPVPPSAFLNGLDVIFTSFPHYVDRFRRQGIPAYYMPLAFDQRIGERLPWQDRTYDTTFVGGISSAHGQRTQFLELLAGSISLDVWGYVDGSLRKDSPILKRHHGEAWGLEMFSLLQRSKITINYHIDVAEDFANNMRLFEATGCGSLLVTDYKDNLNELFEIGREIVAYRAPEECVALIQYFVAHPAEAEAIARAGQQRTLKDHSYAKRMERTKEILERHLRQGCERSHRSPVNLQKVSYGHTPISSSAITAELTLAWQDPGVARRQRALVQQELEAMYRGNAPAVFRILADALTPLIQRNTSLLEIGCASGYYYEALGYLHRRPVAYTGVDYSEAMIELARDYYPRARFQVADGAKLPFCDGQFDIAVSSCILLHVPNYAEHIAETARIAGRYIVAHRTPVCRQRPTQYLTKFAYEVKTIELRFNENDLIAEFAKNGLNLIKQFEYHSQPGADEFEITYVFAKNGISATPVPRPGNRQALLVSQAQVACGSLSGEPSSRGAVPTPEAQLENFRNMLLPLFMDAGVQAVKECLDGLPNKESIINASRKSAEQFVGSPSGLEDLKLKLQSIQNRGAGNFRFYLQPQLEKLFVWLFESNETTNYTYDLEPINKEYLASIIALVTQQPVQRIEGFIHEIVADEGLRNHIREWILKSPQKHVCDLNVHYGRRIGWYAMIRATKPKVVVETGVEKGMGTCVIVRALMRNRDEGFPGFAYGTDIDPKAGFLVQGPYQELGTILYGDSIETLKKFSQSIDFFINDSAHSPEYERQEYATVKDKLSEEAVILGDDSHGSNELRRFAIATRRHFLFFPEKPLAHWYPGAGIGIAFKHS